MPSSKRKPLKDASDHKSNGDPDVEVSDSAISWDSRSPGTRPGDPHQQDSTAPWSIRYWDVKVSPIKKHMIQGIMVPTLRGALSTIIFQKQRRITIEIHRKPSFDSGQMTSNRPRAVPERGVLFSPVLAGSYGCNESLGPDDFVVICFFKPKRRGTSGDSTFVHDDDDDSFGMLDDVNSISSISHSTLSPSKKRDTTDDTIISWIKQCQLSPKDVQILKRNGNTSKLEIEIGKDCKTRTISFQDDDEAQSFVQVLDYSKRLENERKIRQQRSLQRNDATVESKVSESNSAPSSPPSTSLRNISLRTVESLPGVLLSHRSGSKVHHTINADKDASYILVEIVSATALPHTRTFKSLPTKSFTTSPYVIVRDGDIEVHRTSTIQNSTNPIWTLETKSLFLLPSTIESSSVTFVIKDYSPITNETLGTVEVPKQALLCGTGKRIEYKLQKTEATTRKIRDPHKRKGTLALRYRVASKEDIDFLESYYANAKWNRSGIYSNDAILRPNVERTNPMAMTRMIRKAQNGINEYRVRPNADPERPHETKWMTKRQLESESRKPSSRWVETGSGQTGKIYFEILGCNDLPKSSARKAVRSDSMKPNSFACIVFEDNIVNSDVINETARPRWMPWTQRAFVFNFRNPASQIMLGLCDYEPSVNPLMDPGGDGIGKISINIANLRTNTMYTLRYDLRKLDTLTPSSCGSITVRLRITWKSERQGLLSAITMSHPCFIAVPKKSDLRPAVHAIGDETPRHISLQRTKTCLEELQSYGQIIFYLEKAICIVLLWRGHFGITLRYPTLCPDQSRRSDQMTCIERWTSTVTIWLPLHSITAFSWGVLVVRDFNRLPSFLLFAVGWAFLATQEYVRSNPSPWHRCRSYTSMLKTLALGQSSGETIEKNENSDAWIEFHATQENWLKKRMERHEIEKIELQKQQSELDQILKDTPADEVEIPPTDTKEMVFNFAPVVSFLKPLQVGLYKLCVSLRIAKSILLWRESILCFWIVTTSFLLSCSVFWINWAFFLSWASKIFVWVFLGPWMKLVDIFYFHRFEHTADDEILRALISRYLRQQEQAVDAACQRKMAREETLKLQVLKKYMFGKYLMRVPTRNEERHWDYQTAFSTAEPYDEKHDCCRPQLTKRLWGQGLVGNMIPLREKPMRCNDEHADQPRFDSDTRPLLANAEESYGSFALSNLAASHIQSPWKALEDAV